MTRLFSALFACALIGGALAAPASASRPATAPIKCNDDLDGALPVSITVEGQAATGQYAVPASPPTTLVVFAHGFGHTSDSWVEHMNTAAAEHGVAAVTMDYRNSVMTDLNGDGLRESQGWRVMEGAEDSIAFAQSFEQRCKSIENIVVFGVSMGGNTSGLAVALAGADGLKKTDGSPLFDYWFDIEGAVNVIETYTEARLAASANATAASAYKDIEQEMGGPIEQKPDVYLEHTVVARMDDISAAGLEGAVVVHGLDDGLVPYNQGREMATLLAKAQIPTDMVTVARKTEESERETTLSGHALSNVDPNYRSPLAGHASERSTTHVVMVTAFDRLYELLEEGKTPGPYTETLVDAYDRYSIGN